MNPTSAPQKLVDFVRGSLQAGICDVLELRHLARGGGTVYVDHWEARGKLDELVPRIWQQASSDSDLGPTNEERRYELVRKKGEAVLDRTGLAFRAREVDATDGAIRLVQSMQHIEHQRAINLEEAKESRLLAKSREEERAADTKSIIATLRGINDELREENKVLRADSRLAHKQMATSSERLATRYAQIFDMHEEMASDKGTRDARLIKERGKNERMDRMVKYAETAIMPLLFARLKEAISPPKAMGAPPSSGSASGNGGASSPAPSQAATQSVTRLIDFLTGLDPTIVAQMLSCLPEEKAAEFMEIVSSLNISDAAPPAADAQPKKTNGAAHA